MNTEILGCSSEWSGVGALKSAIEVKWTKTYYSRRLIEMRPIGLIFISILLLCFCLLLAEKVTAAGEVSGSVAMGTAAVVSDTNYTGAGKGEERTLTPPPISSGKYRWYSDSEGAFLKIPRVKIIAMEITGTRYQEDVPVRYEDVKDKRWKGMVAAAKARGVKLSKARFGGRYATSLPIVPHYDANHGLFLAVIEVKGLSRPRPVPKTPDEEAELWDYMEAGPESLTENVAIYDNTGKKLWTRPFRGNAVIDAEKRDGVWLIKFCDDRRTFCVYYDLKGRRSKGP